MPRRSVSVAIGVGIFGLVAGLAAYLIFKKKNPAPPPGPDTNPEPTDEDCVAKIANLSFEKGFIYLKMADGRYLCCNDPGTIFTNEARGPETKWVVEAFPGGIRIKNQYYNRYLSSEDNGGLNAAVTVDKVSSNEIFAPTCNASTGTYYLLGAHGGYVGSVGAYYDVKAIATSPTATEVIVIETD